MYQFGSFFSHFFLIEFASKAPRFVFHQMDLGCFLVWIRESVKTRGRTNSSLVLSNNYLEININNGDNTSKHIICYDQTSKKFNRWEFKNDGANTFWIGEWNKKDKTMTWDFIDFSGNGIIGQIIESVASEEVINSEIIMKDKDGNTLLKINSTKIKI